MSRPTKFSKAIAEAASQTDHGSSDPSAEYFSEFDGNSSKSDQKSPQNEREARAEAVAAFADAAAIIGDKYGCAVIWDRPRIGRRRTTEEYEFWKKPIMAFIEFPETLDLGSTSLARKYAAAERNFNVTRDTFRAALSKPSRIEAITLLKKRGYDLKLPATFSIRDVQNAMKDRRDRAYGSEKFKPTVEIVGETVYCNGKSFKMQLTDSGQKRIRAGNKWIPLDALIAFISSKG